MAYFKYENNGKGSWRTCFLGVEPTVMTFYNTITY